MENKISILAVVFVLAVLATLFYVSLTLAQSQSAPEITYHNTLENRTAVSDSYLIMTTDYRNGTILKTYQAHLYSNPVNMLDNGVYRPFTDVASLQWNDLSESFVLSWQGREIRIKPLIVDNQNNEYTISGIKTLYPSVNFNYNIERTKKYRYGITLSNLSQEFQRNINSVKFSLVGFTGLSANDLRNDGESIILENTIEVYFDRGLTSDFGFSVANANLNVGNVANGSEINVDMIIGLHERENENI